MILKAQNYYSINWKKSASAQIRAPYSSSTRDGVHYRYTTLLSPPSYLPPRGSFWVPWRTASSWHCYYWYLEREEFGGNGHNFYFISKLCTIEPKMRGAQAGKNTKFMPFFFKSARAISERALQIVVLIRKKYWKIPVNFTPFPQKILELTTSTRGTRKKNVSKTDQNVHKNDPTHFVLLVGRKPKQGFN